MRIFIFLAAIILGISTLNGPTFVQASSFDSAMNAYDRQDYYNAASQFSKLAEQGDPHSQHMLGKMYANGEGIAKNYKQAYKWLHLAEEGGVESATRIKKRISKRMSTKKINKAMRLADTWRKNHNDSISKQTDRNFVEIKDVRIVKEVQEKLKVLGYYFGGVDGLSGPGTSNAIMAYQHSQGVQKDGIVSEFLLELMGIPSSTVQTPPSQLKNKELAALKKDLRALIHKAKRLRSAEPWLISSLEKLASKNYSLWPRIVFRENFKSVEYKQSDAWRVNDGNFRLEPETGLVGVPNTSWGRHENINDLAVRLLETFINQRQASTFAQNMVQIQHNQVFSNSFSLTVKTDSLQSTEGLLFSCTTKEDSTTGYQFAFHPGGGNQARLFFISGDSAREIPSKVSQVNLALNKPHTIVWTKDNNGTMIVTVDGQQLLTADESSTSLQNFNILTLTHFGEKIIYQDIQLRDTMGSE